MSVRPDKSEQTKTLGEMDIHQENRLGQKKLNTIRNQGGELVKKRVERF